MATNNAGTGDSCKAAALAAMEVIEEECGDGKKPTDFGGDVVTMMPRDLRQRKKDINVADISKREVEGLLSEHEWLDEVATSMCQTAGLKSGSDAFKTCKRNYARKVLEG